MTEIDKARDSFRRTMDVLAPFMQPTIVETCPPLSGAVLRLRPHNGGSVNVDFEGTTKSGVVVRGQTRLTVSPDTPLVEDSAGAPWGFATGTVWQRPNLANEHYEVPVVGVVTQVEEDAICLALANAAVEYFDANPLAMAAGAARVTASRLFRAIERDVQARDAAATAAMDRESALLMNEAAIQCFDDTLSVLREAAPAMSP